MKAHYTHAIHIFTCAFLSVLVSCGPSVEERRAELDKKIHSLDMEIAELESQTYGHMIDSAVVSSAGGLIAGAGMATGAVPVAAAGVGIVAKSLEYSDKAQKARDEHNAKVRERDALIRERNEL